MFIGLGDYVSLDACIGTGEALGIPNGLKMSEACQDHGYSGPEQGKLLQSWPPQRGTAVPGVLGWGRVEMKGAGSRVDKVGLSHFCSVEFSISPS